MVLNGIHWMNTCCDSVQKLSFESLLLSSYRLVYIQNITPAISGHFLRHPFTNKVHYLNSWNDFLMCRRSIFLIRCFSVSFPQKLIWSFAGPVPLFSDLTSCTPTESNLFSTNSLVTDCVNGLKFKSSIWFISWTFINPAALCFAV